MATSTELIKLSKYILKTDLEIIPQDLAVKHATDAKIGQYFVINTAPSYLKNGHYVCLVKLSKKKAIFFDPLASPLSLICLKDLIKEYETVYFLDKAIQHKNSEFCGFFVIGFLKAYEDDDIAEFLKKFKKNKTMKNNKIIYAFLRKKICRQILEPDM